MQPESGPNPQTLATLDLVKQAQAGDSHALERLASRYLPRLVRWASGRLPAYARGHLDTEDVVQEALIRSLGKVDRLRPEAGGFFQAYTRQAVLNAIRDAVRRARPRADEAALERQADDAPSPLEETLGREAVARYEAGLRKLSDAERAAVVARIELKCSWQEIADDLGKNTPQAARMMVTRALKRLAEEMADVRP